MNEFFLVILGALLALLGSLVQVFVSRWQTKSDKKQELLISAYREYLTGLAERASLLHAHSERTEAATAKMVAGKQMISAYAPVEVVSALAILERSPMRLTSEETQKAMVGLVLAMRKSTDSIGSNLDEDIHAILFSVDVREQ